MLTILGSGICVVQIALWATHRPTLSRRPYARYAVAAWCLVMLAHLGYEWSLDRAVGM